MCLVINKSKHEGVSWDVSENGSSYYASKDQNHGYLVHEFTTLHFVQPRSRTKWVIYNCTRIGPLYGQYIFYLWFRLLFFVLFCVLGLHSQEKCMIMIFIFQNGLGEEWLYLIRSILFVNFSDSLNLQ